MSRTYGGGFQGIEGGELVVSGVPASALKLLLDSWIAAKAKTTGRYVKVTTGANYEFDIPAYGEEIGGVIKWCEPNGSTYDLSVRLLAVPSERTGYVVRGVPVIECMAYSGTMALGDTVMSAGTAGQYVTSGGTSAGQGYVLGKDTKGGSFVDVYWG